MENYFLAASHKTPKISCDAQTGEIAIAGRSIPENSIEFYAPLIQWLVAYAQKPSPETNMRVQLEYFNTSSSKCLVDVFRKLELLQKKDCKVSITWLYEHDDEDMLESGEDFKEILKIPMQIKSYHRNLKSQKK